MVAPIEPAEYWHLKLHEAVETDNFPLAQEALEKGADVNHRGSEGMTLLNVATAGGHVDRVKALLQVDAIDINMKNNCGHNALEIARAEGHTEIIALLERAPAEIAERQRIVDEKAEQERQSAAKKLKERQAARRGEILTKYTGNDKGRGI